MASTRRVGQHSRSALLPRSSQPSTRECREQRHSREKLVGCRGVGNRNAARVPAAARTGIGSPLATDDVGDVVTIDRGLEVITVHEVVSQRAGDLGIEEIYQGVNDKGALLRELMQRKNLKPVPIWYNFIQVLFMRGPVW